ncbi:MAG TPA: universal stress protein [Miltoncostaeaceae bacterium]|nr:universal stress protein [Miltoncostaeaceae bacterium]
MDAPFRHIACCIDDSDAARQALAEARRLRALGEGRLSLLHVVEFPVPYATGLGGWVPNPVDLVDVARGWLVEETKDVPEGDPIVLEGHPAGEVCDWAGENGVDLLVCASHRNLAARITLGSFAHYLVNHAPCPVLVLRSSPQG